MTDMRATERLLEVIEDELLKAYAAMQPRDWQSLEEAMVGARRSAQEMQLAIVELRRRGDTLVRAADLGIVLEEAAADRNQVQQEFGVPGDPVTDADREWQEAIDRLENALGGKPL